MHGCSYLRASAKTRSKNQEGLPHAGRFANFIPRLLWGPANIGSPRPFDSSAPVSEASRGEAIVRRYIPSCVIATFPAARKTVELAVRFDHIWWFQSGSSDRIPKLFKGFFFHVIHHHTSTFF
jgi:hypothetical protein